MYIDDFVWLTEIANKPKKYFSTIPGTGLLNRDIE